MMKRLSGMLVIVGVLLGMPVWAEDAPAPRQPDVAGIVTPVPENMKIQSKVPDGPVVKFTTEESDLSSTRFILLEGNSLYKEYLEKLQWKISKEWVPPVGEEDKIVVIQFVVNRKGELVGYEILQSSGSTKANEFAITALKNVFPFSPFPAGGKKETLDVSMLFDWNVQAPEPELDGIKKNQSRDPDLAPYMAGLQKTIRRKWNPPKEFASKRIVARFSIDKNGNLRFLKLLKASGSERANLTALQAIKATFPYFPLPEGYSKDKIDVQFTFDYAIHGGSTLFEQTPAFNKLDKDEEKRLNRARKAARERKKEEIHVTGKDENNVD